ncbi:pilin [Patescibacteria group bacterium]
MLVHSRKNRNILLFSMLLTMMFAPLFVFAQSEEIEDPCVFDESAPDQQYIQIQTKIPGLTKDIPVRNEEGNIIGEKHLVKDLPCFIIGIYKYFSGAAAIIATVMMMYGGYKYVISFGSPQKMKDAQDTIVAAMVGLVITLGSYLLLYTINPKLVEFPDLVVEPVSKVAQSRIYTPDLCEVENSATDVPCGQLEKVSEIDFGDELGVETKYCMGTYCQYGLGTQSGSISHRQVCQVQRGQHPSEQDVFISGSCRSSIPVNGIQGVSSVEVMNFPFADTPVNPFLCGELALDPISGDYYVSFKTSFFSNSGKNFCVLDGDVGYAVEGPANPLFSNFLTAGFIANMYSSAN